MYGIYVDGMLVNVLKTFAEAVSVLVRMEEDAIIRKIGRRFDV